jgi:dTDP-L-rhamnose 4-epimerase
MAKVLVTGGAGFIGSHTTDKLIDLGYEVKILDNLQKPIHLKGKPNYLNPKAEFIFGDVRDPNVLLYALHDVIYLFHFAAYQDYLPDFSSFYSVNAVSTALIYELIVANRLPIKKIVVASSQFVQGEGLYRKKDGSIISPYQRSLEQLERGEWDWIDEDGNQMEWLRTSEQHANPSNAYAISKYAQELTAIAHGKRYDIPSVVLRYSIVQGSRQSLYNAYSGACRIFNLHYFLGKAPTIYEDGLQKRDFIDVRDVVAANILALENSATDNEVFCVGSGKVYTIREFAGIVAKLHGKEYIEPNIPGEFRWGDTRNACSDITKLRSLGWEPKYNACDSVEDYISYLNHQEDIADILGCAEKVMKNLNIVRGVK